MQGLAAMSSGVFQQNAVTALTTLLIVSLGFFLLVCVVLRAVVCFWGLFVYAWA